MTTEHDGERIAEYRRILREMERSEDPKYYDFLAREVRKAEEEG